jgi:hypothetical protein
VDALINHRRYDEEGESRQDGTHNDERAQNAEEAVLQMTAVLEEPDHREQDVGDEPRQEKGCEYTAQSAEQHDDAYDNDDPYQAAYELIEVDLLTKHICHFFCNSAAKVRILFEMRNALRVFFCGKVLRI